MFGKKTPKKTSTQLKSLAGKVALVILGVIIGGYFINSALAASSCPSNCQLSQLITMARSQVTLTKSDIKALKKVVDNTFAIVKNVQQVSNSTLGIASSTLQIASSTLATKADKWQEVIGYNYDGGLLDGTDRTNFGKAMLSGVSTMVQFRYGSNTQSFICDYVSVYTEFPSVAAAVTCVTPEIISLDSWTGSGSVYRSDTYLFRYHADTGVDEIEDRFIVFDNANNVVSYGTRSVRPTAHPGPAYFIKWYVKD